MNKFVITSLRRGAGKTSCILGIAKAIDKPFAYLKPFGDRLLYRKKRLWDYDSALISSIFGLTDQPDQLSLGFDHSKLRYMYDAATTNEKLRTMVTELVRDQHTLLVESGQDMSYGISVHLDALSVATALNAGLIIVLHGDHDTMLDDCVYLHEHVNFSRVPLAGFIVNRCVNSDDFMEHYLPRIKAMGLPVLGVLPYNAELEHVSVGYLAERLLAKVLTGEQNLNGEVQHIFIGAMAAEVAMANPLWKKKNRLIITSGDRSDMILAAIESGTVGIVLTNNILPKSAIMARAAEKNVPMLLMPTDTFQTAKQIDDLEPLITRNDTAKIALLEGAVRKHLDLAQLLKD